MTKKRRTKEIVYLGETPGFKAGKGKIQDEPGTPCNARKEDSSPKSSMPKGHRSQTEKAPYEQSWNNFSSKIAIILDYNPK